MLTKAISEKLREIERLEDQHYCDGMSDSRYHTNGRYAAMRSQILDARKELAELERQAALGSNERAA